MQIDFTQTMRSGRIDLMDLVPGHVLELYSPASPRHEAIFSLTSTLYRRLIIDEDGGYPDVVEGFIMMAYCVEPINFNTPLTRFQIHRIVCRDELLCYNLFDSRRQRYEQCETGRITAAKLHAGARTLRLF